MKIKDCQYYAVVDISTATVVLQDKLVYDEPFSEETCVYEEHEYGFNGHKLTYTGYIKIDNPHKWAKDEPEFFKLHIFVDNYWPFSIGEK